MGNKSRRARQEAQEHSSRRTKRGLALLTAGLASAWAVCGVASRSSDVAPVKTSSTLHRSPPVNSRAMLEEAFSRALDHPEERQEFLDLLQMAHPRSYCQRIVYDPGFEQSRAYNLEFAQRFNLGNVQEINQGPLIPYAKAPIGIKGFGRTSQAPIFVANHFFDQRWNVDNSPLFSLDDVISTIIDHEGQHDRDFCEGMNIGSSTITYRDFPGPLYPDQFFGYLKEARAYYAQLKAIDRYLYITNHTYANTLQQAEVNIAGVYLYAEGIDSMNDPQVRNIARRQLTDFRDIRITYLGARPDGKSHDVRVDFDFVRKPELHRVDISTMQGPH